MNNIEVSIVIVCMNNYIQLKNCLDSILKYNHRTSYEVLLVAYFFSEDNLKLLREEYPWVIIIISDEIRGFSANNNIALRQAKGKYCFILNDDTYMTMPVIDYLFATMEKHSEITALSPQVLRPDGTIQFCGFPPHNWMEWLMILFKLKKDAVDKAGSYVDSQGLIKTYDLLGASIFIRTTILKEMGFLDERYFYGPEDRALTTKLNQNGYSCWVDNSIKLVHLGGATGGKNTKTVLATRPANRKGWVLYYDNGSKMRKIILKCAIFVNSAFWSIGWLIKSISGNKSAKNSFHANLNVCRTIFSNSTPTETFKSIYTKL